MTPVAKGAPEDLKVDFNEVYDDDYVWASLRRTPGVNINRLLTGEWVRLVDDDGAICLAIILAVDGPIVTCKIDWSTWRSFTSDLEPPWQTIPTIAL